ncbi:MAG: sigma-70 family RNA polymerase sigma factor [Candidatus Marinimicrobia bacterium]|nr:sigma-70 family RNA polymerase sigma factor [Candidatus Neomarinimicrobiota bacterium]
MRIEQNQIYYKYAGMVTVIASRMISDSETVKDAVQEVWFEVYRSLGSFQNKSKLSTWMYTIAFRTILRFSKKERQYSLKFLEEYFSGKPLYNESDIEQDSWVKTQCDNCLTGILHCLDNESRMVYILRDIARLKYHEIAEINQKSELSVRKNISRCRQKLKTFLTKQCSLFNPDSPKKCKMAKHVKDINLLEEYKKIEKVVSMSNFYRVSNQVLPGKEYWIDLLNAD